MSEEINENNSGPQENTQNPEQKKVNIQLDIDDITSQGIYSNLAISNYSKEEFILDFVFLQPHIPKGKIRSRIILSPKNAKRLSQMLQANIKDYENKLGPINEEPNPPGIRFSFN
jgi:hypothetical protein